MAEPYRVAEETFVVPGALPVPGIGWLPVNAMVIRGAQPMIVDTLAIVQRKEFLESAFSLVDPEEVRWLFLSHEDRDHSGSVMEVLDRCPNAKLVTNFLGLGKLSEEFSIPPERVHMLNDGESLEIGDRSAATDPRSARTRGGCAAGSRGSPTWVRCRCPTRPSSSGCWRGSPRPAMRPPTRLSSGLRPAPSFIGSPI